jgi:ATP-dependent Lon protease
MFFNDKKENTKFIPLLPLRDVVVFPHMIIPLFVGREKSIKALEVAEDHDSRILLVAQKNAKSDMPRPGEMYDVGVIAEILQMLKLPDGTLKVLVEGQDRAEIVRFSPREEYFEVEVREATQRVQVTREVEALMRSVCAKFEEYIKLNVKMPPEAVLSTSNIEDPDRLADVIVSHMSIKVIEKQKMLETINPVERLEALAKLLDSETEILQIEKRIRGRVRHQMEKSQKEYYLNEQMRAIQKELGSGRDDPREELNKLRKKIKEAKMSEEAEEKALKELKRLEQMPPMSAEGTVVLNYIDWLISLPWSKSTKDKLVISDAERILDEDHYGLEKIKERIIEYLAVRQLVKKIKGPILCFVGPPGVGKTSLSKSVARSMGRKFVRLSLGGVRDEAEIRGHRRTYIGAMPGRIIQSMKKVKSKNPVFLLDEIDKMSTDFRGDPSAALLEVLGPEQNDSFSDHYLEVDFDLSEVFFITTANVLHRIPQPLKDRMEVIQLPGYTEEEKVKIAEMFLVPKQLEANGLKPDNLRFSGAVLSYIIRRHTREAGVRNLERELARICRKVARDIVKNGKDTKVVVTVRNLHKFLGPAKFKHRKAEEKDEVGLATGLAWTEVGGEILVSEVTVMDGKGNLTITGQLGDVMKESAQAALSYVRSKARELGLSKHFYQKTDIHIHVPEGAIPKDGPSAGITMATALASALTKRPVKRDVAMTGEITLRGRVLPVGGVKEKILAAHRAEIETVIIPRENEKDLKDIPVKVRSALRIVSVDHMDDVLREALWKESPESPLKEEDRDYDKAYEQAPLPDDLVTH